MKKSEASNLFRKYQKSQLRFRMVKGHKYVLSTGQWSSLIFFPMNFWALFGLYPWIYALFSAILFTLLPEGELIYLCLRQKKGKEREEERRARPSGEGNSSEL